MCKKRLKAVATMILCTLICVLGSSVVCNAAQQKYVISEIDDMVLFLPDNMMAITRSADQSDRYFSVFGLDYQTTMKNFKNGDIYLQGMDSMSGVTITVTMTKTEESKGIGNYNRLKTEELSEVTNNFLGQAEYTSCTPDKANNIVWLDFATNVNNNGNLIKAYQANTIYDGMSVNITLQRNDGDVTAEDYETFNSVVSSANFLRSESLLNSNIMQFIFIGAGVLVLIVIVVLIVVIVKQAKKHRKKNKNDKIIEELADKYTKHRNNYVETEEYQDTEPEKTEYVEDNNEDFLSGVESTKIETPPIQKIVSDSEIDEILGFAEQSKVELISNISEKEEEPVSVDEQEDDNQEEVVENESSVVEETASDDEQYDFNEFDEEIEEYNNDEELVRQDSKRTKFVDSDDFFEEAPKKTMGIISSKDIRDAEDYDVINEVEKRVSEVEKSNSTVGENVLKTLKKIGGGFKSFGIHFGYFCTNISRMIKRRNAQKKRQKAEQERRERARMRAERERQQRRQMQDGGLVQVHRRNHNISQNGRPTSQRRPSQNGNRRPPQSGNRRPPQNGNRRPNGNSRRR